MKSFTAVPFLTIKNIHNSKIGLEQINFSTFCDDIEG